MAPIKSTPAVKSKKITDFFSSAPIKRKNSSAGMMKEINNNDENSPVSTVVLKCRSNEINISNGSLRRTGSANKSSVLDDISNIEPPKKKVCIDENLKSNLTEQIDQVSFGADASASSSDWLNSTAKDNSEVVLMNSQESAELSAIFRVPEFDSSSDRVKFLDLVNMSSPQRDSQDSVNFLDISILSLGTTDDACDDKDSAQVEMQQTKPRRRLLKYESDDD